MKSLICGADPGLGGAICFWSPELETVEMFDMPTFEVERNRKLKREVDRYQLAALFRERAHLVRLVVIEQVASMPNQGVASMFAFGKAAGMIEMAAAAAQLPIHDVTPAIWKRAMRVSADKDTSRRAASNLAPHHAHHWRLKEHDGRAEAYLLARYGEKAQ